MPYECLNLLFKLFEVSGKTQDEGLRICEFIFPWQLRIVSHEADSLGFQER